MKKILILLPFVALLAFLTYTTLANDYDYENYGVSKFFEFAKQVALYSMFVYIVILALVRIFSEKGGFVTNLGRTIFYCSWIFLVVWFIDVTFGQISILSEALGNPSLSPSISAWWVWGFFVNLYLIITYSLIKIINENKIFE